MARDRRGGSAGSESGAYVPPSRLAKQYFKKLSNVSSDPRWGPDRRADAARRDRLVFVNPRAFLLVDRRAELVAFHLHLEPPVAGRSTQDAYPVKDVGPRRELG